MGLRRRYLYSLFIWLLILALIGGCSSNGNGDMAIDGQAEDGGESVEEELGEDMPSLKVAYTYSNYHAPLIVAAAKNNGFQDEGIYLEEIVEGEEYNLISGEEKICKIELMAVRDGEEVMALLSGGKADLGFSSIEFPLRAIDKGDDIKVIGPISMDGMALVMGQDEDVEGVEGFMEYIREREEPISIGYHAPSTIPTILFQAAMGERAVTITEDPNRKDKDILLVDLKGTANLIPSLQSERLVDGWVGPSPFPELAELEGAGNIVLDMRELNPMGRWNRFPYGVVSATGAAIGNYHGEITEFFKLLSLAIDYIDKNREEAGGLVADWIGMSSEAAVNSTVTYSMEISQEWLDNVDVLFKHLQNSRELTGELGDGELDNIRGNIFYFAFALNSQ